LPGRCEDRIYDILSGKLITPGEITGRLGLNYKTARDVLMRLAPTGRDVRCKASGRMHMFWGGGFESSLSIRAY
jgi:ribosomal protein S25